MREAGQRLAAIRRRRTIKACPQQSGETAWPRTAFLRTQSFLESQTRQIAAPLTEGFRQITAARRHLRPHQSRAALPRRACPPVAGGFAFSLPANCGILGFGPRSQRYGAARGAPCFGRG